ncbi:UPF0481 protein At3g47200-like [Prunus avium]|uniref:UPF0481 protein At3g47200-like n=1 Tax=Prunus avium TaxID=42229 RepID=A0A6P5TJM8_PRUAV|nr:UPF0481 protein At3g47200-like [Prunus avium]XP_021827653.1 UPF0481 protein At3g47200-like [Prunus avium]XP_021827654.1 UPF0481 protein At3g47200-like [Prunus avium]
MKRKTKGSNQSALHDRQNPLTPLATSLKEELHGLSPLSSLCCIYRVPKRLRHVNENAYTPQVVSIGPFHHGKKSLKAMEEHKKRYLQDFLRRTNVSMEDIVKRIRDQEARVRSSYAETIEFSVDEFVRIILVDATFVIELLLKSYFPEFRNENDRLFNKPWMLQDVWPDLRLLENQLPFFILEDLFNLHETQVSSNSNHTMRLSVITLSHDWFKTRMLIEGAEGSLQRMCSSKVEHFVDLCRNLYLPFSFELQAAGRLETLTTPSITELHRAGVKFKVGSTPNLFDIRFADGILEIPKFTISGETELTIRNLVAFEQCHCMENFINDYVVMMDRFVNTPKDVELLVKYGIVENWLGDSNEVSTMINNLAEGVTIEANDFYFAALCEDLNKYCSSTWHNRMANLRQNYFHTPWATISLVAAAVLLVLTLIQAVCSIISVA